MGSRPDPDLARRGEAAPSPASLGFGLAAPLQPGAPSAAQAESGPGPARVGSRPDPYFGEAGPSRPCLRGFALAWQRLRRLAAPSSAGGGRRPAGPQASWLPARPGLRPAGRGCTPPNFARPSPGDPFASWCAFERAGRRWAWPHTIGPPARPGLRPLGRGCALPCVAWPLHGGAFGGAWADAESDTASDSELRSSALRRAPVRSLRHRAAPHAPPPLPPSTGVIFFRCTAQPVLPPGESTGSSRVRRPSGCPRAQLFFPPTPPGEQHSTGPWPSARTYASRHSRPNGLS